MHCAFYGRGRRKQHRRGGGTKELPRHSGLLLMERTMLTMVLVVLGALFAAVLGHAMLTPWPSADVPGRPQ